MKEKLLSVADMLILQRVSLLIPLVHTSLPLASHSPLRSLFRFDTTLAALSGLLTPKPPEQQKLFVRQKLRELLPACVASGETASPTAPAAGLAHQRLRLRLCCVRPLARKRGRGAP